MPRVLGPTKIHVAFLATVEFTSGCPRCLMNAGPSATDRSGKKREAAPTASDYAVNLINPARRSVVAHVTTLVHTNCAHPTARRQFSLSYSYILI